MQRENDSSRAVKQAMVHRLAREGIVARAAINASLCRRIMAAVDDAEPRREVAGTCAGARNPRRRVGLVAGIGACAAAALVIGIGLGIRPPVTDPSEPAIVQVVSAAPQQTAEQAPLAAVVSDRPSADEAGGIVFSPTAVAVEPLNVLTEQANPLDELNHDAQLAGQMVLAALPTQLAD